MITSYKKPVYVSKSHACHAKAAAEAQNAPKRTSDPVQALQVPRLPRKSSGRAAEPKTHQSVHQTPCKRSKSHACHAKAAEERRSPKRAKAYIRPRASAPSPTPATQKQRQSGGAQIAPKRTSDPVQVLQVPRLPRKSSGRAAEPKTRQSVHQTPRKCSKPHACHAKAAAAAEPKTRQRVHQTPRKCSKPHACHAKAAAERRSPKPAKAYIRPRASAPSATPATQKQRQSGGAQNAPKRTSDPVQVLQVPRLPRKSSGRAAEPKTRQSVHQTPRKCSKPHACHAKAAAERRSPKRAKAYIRPRASAPSPTPATQKQRQSGGDQNAPKRTSDPAQALQAPRLPRKSSGRAAEPKTHQSVHQTPCKCSKSHACHAKAAEERRSPKRAKAYIRPRAGAASPTPATQKQRQSSGDQGAPKRTSDPVQAQQVPRLPRESSGRAAEPKTRQSVHQTPGKCSKSHACHAKAAAERRSPKRAKAYIRPRASAPSPTPATQKQRQSGGAQNAPKSVHQTPRKCSNSHACHAKAAAERRSPKRAKAYIRPRASAPSPTPATQKQRQSGGAQNAPKRTSDPAQALQAPRLPRKSSGRAAEPKTRQSVRQTPCKCSKSHACHAKAAAERRRPKRAKVYIRPRASAPSATPATQKQRQSGGAQNAPKRTSDPVQVLQAPRLPRKSSGRAAEPKTRQSVHQTPCRCRKSHACHAKAAAKAASSCVMSSCVMSSCVTSTCAMSSCVRSTCAMSSCVMSTCVMSSCVM